MVNSEKDAAATLLTEINKRRISAAKRASRARIDRKVRTSSSISASHSESSRRSGSPAPPLTPPDMRVTHPAVRQTSGHRYCISPLTRVGSLCRERLCPLAIWLGLHPHRLTSSVSIRDSRLSMLVPRTFCSGCICRSALPDTCLRHSVLWLRLTPALSVPSCDESCGLRRVTTGLPR